jgi:acyl carrier protein
MATSTLPAQAGSQAPVDVFEVVAQALVDECGVDRARITRDSNVVTDLGLDSLAFLDLCYALDTRLKIRIPFEDWVNDINSGKLDRDTAFVLKHIVFQVETMMRKA